MRKLLIILGYTLVFALFFGYCDPAYYDFDATDPDGDPYRFSMVEGPRSIDSSSGLWSFTPMLSDLGEHFLPLDICNGFTGAVSIGTGPSQVILLTAKKEAAVAFAAAAVLLVVY